MLKIGELSRIGQVSVKTLRYYDAVGILKPHQIDPVNGYRYYSFDMLPTLNRILALKELSLSLEQIKHLLSDDITAEQLRGMLRLKQVEIQQQMAEEKEKLARVEARLKMIEQENKMPNYEIVIKKVKPVFAATVRDVIPRYPEQGHMWDELEAFLALHQIQPQGPCFTIYYSDEPNIDTEVCEPVSGSILEDPKVNHRQLSGVDTMATVIHKGPFISIGEAYAAILKWIEVNQYRINGPSREVYLRPAANGSQTDPETVTEIQFPVEKT
ncbi:MAG TPA: MerR family transcriptional regulator [Anaerolineales bacterium]|nr:MerR family transcriptional regulator [Anaerolineales bacterium]